MAGQSHAKGHTGRTSGREEEQREEQRDERAGERAGPGRCTLQSAREREDVGLPSYGANRRADDRHKKQRVAPIILVTVPGNWRGLDPTCGSAGGATFAAPYAVPALCDCPSSVGMPGRLERPGR